jgi:hypothetical protein
MNDDKAAAIFYVMFELQAEISWPIGGVIVEYNHLIFVELGPEAAEVTIGARRGDDRDPKPARVFQLLFQYGRGQLPVVIGSSALSVKKQYAYQFHFRRCRRYKEDCARKDDKRMSLHTAFLLARTEFWRRRDGWHRKSTKRIPRGESITMRAEISSWDTSRQSKVPKTFGGNLLTAADVEDTPVQTEDFGAVLFRMGNHVRAP